jgi:sporadic carbohydrate cluster 2OG-Fe(II) oxygenase
MKITEKKKNIITKKFLKEGYIIFDIENLKILKKIRDLFKKTINSTLKNKNKNIDIFNQFHTKVDTKKLNEIRLSVYSKINSKSDFVTDYFNLAKNHLEIICGNELAVQRKVNLSIQLPNDDSSLLPIHSDVWSGCSPFEVVLWVPFVNVSKTKSMFIFPKKLNDKVYKNFSSYPNSEFLFKKFEKKVKFLNLKYGQGLIFSHSIIHGNRVNLSNETRWSLNCRFKSLMSPYYKKSVAETFLPLNIKPATSIGFDYEHPKT